MTVARKRPTAVNTSPTSSGCWCPRVFFARLVFLTRAGTRGLTTRFLRRRAMAASFDTSRLTPLTNLVLHHTSMDRRPSREEIPNNAIERLAVLLWRRLRGQGSEGLERAVQEVLAPV